MKNILIKSFLLISFLVMLGACQEKEDIELNPDAKAVVSLSVDTVVLEENTAADEAVVISWTEPDFGFDGAETYKVLLDFVGTDLSEARSISVGNVLSKTFTEGQLNAELLALGVEPNTATDIVVVVQTKLSDFQSVYSEPVIFNVTPFSSLLDLSTTWGVVGSATPNGWDGPDIPFYQTGVDGVYTAYASLVDGEMKFRENNEWTLNYGDTGADGSLEEGGDNIAVTAGNYKITLNLNALTWSMEEFAWGIVGSATPNGWDGPDVPLNYDPFSDTFKAAVTLVDGEMKFRQNNDWAVNYGDTGADGTLEASGDNIIVEAGNYIVTLDFSDSDNPTYSLESTDLWGIVGDATPNGWDGPDVKFTPDFGGNEGIFYITGITLTDGEWKIRQNDAWGVNYGDTGVDGSLELGGDNIAVTAGVYNITLDFSDPENPTYIIE